MADPADDDIDLETLQAQIDMSLAFTQELVASWIKPIAGSSSHAQSKGSADAEKELEQLLRRPPRYLSALDLHLRARSERSSLLRTIPV